jgi:O-antigen ligase
MERLAFNAGLRYRMAQNAGRAPNPPRRGPDEAARPMPALGVGSVPWPSTLAWRGTLAFTAVAFIRPQDTFRPLELLHLAELAAIAGILGLVFGRLSRGLTVSIVTPEVIGMLAFGAAMLVGMPFSYWPGGSVNVFTDIFMKVLLIFVLMVNTIDRPKRLDRFVWLIVLCAGYIAARAVIDYARGVHLVEGNRIGGAVGGIFGNPNDLALNMVVFLPFAIVWAFRQGSIVLRGSALLAALCMLATVILTRSRGGSLGLVAMLALLVIRSYRVRPSIPIALVLLLLVGLPFAPGSFWVRMSSIFDQSQDATGSRQARKDLMLEGWHVYLEHPVFGIGLGQFVNYDPDDRKEAWNVTHNAPLQVAAELGTIGLVPFVFLIYSGFSAARSARKMLVTAGAGAQPPPRRRSMRRLHAMQWQPHDALTASVTALTPSLIGWLVCAQFGSVALNWTFYYVLALAVAAREIASTHVAAAHPKAA